MPCLTKDQRVSICLEYVRVNNAREVIPAALVRYLKTNVYVLTIVRLNAGYCCINILYYKFSDRINRKRRDKDWH